jgi:hypothetical protein
MTENNFSTYVGMYLEGPGNVSESVEYIFSVSCYVGK